MPRLFVGIAIPDDLRQSLAAAAGGIEGARWVEPSDYHVTLRFIGDVDNAEADRLADALSLVPGEPFRMHTDGYAVFGGDKPRLLHLAIKREPALLALQERVEFAARHAGFEPGSRRFAPHVTMARLRGRKAEAVSEWITSRLPPVPTAFEVDRFHLYTARPGGGGPYHAALEYPLEEE